MRGTRRGARERAEGDLLSGLGAARGALAGALALAGVVGCGEPTPPVGAGSAAPPTPVVVERVAPERVRPAVAVPGVVEAERRIELAFRVGGFVERFHAEEGEAVEAGAALAELDPEDFEQEVRAARARLERAAARARDAKRTLARRKELLARESLSQEAYEGARSAHAVAAAEEREARVELERAERRHERTVLRAPVPAVVERRLVELHEWSAAGAPALVLAQIDTVTVRAALADAQLARLRVGAPVRVTTPLEPERAFEGRVARIDVAADPATRTVPFEVALANPDHALRPELAVEVSLPLDAARERILVPLAAVLRDAEATPFGFVAVGEDGAVRAERRRLVLGELHGERVAVREGLEEGERLVVRGQHFLRADEALRPLREGAP